jgi:hypothetical protein
MRNMLAKRYLVATTVRRIWTLIVIYWISDIDVSRYLEILPREIRRV